MLKFLRDYVGFPSEAKAGDENSLPARAEPMMPRAESVILDLNSPQVAEYLRGGPVSASGVTVTPERAMNSEAVYRCVNLLTGLIGDLAFDVKRREPDGDIHNDDEHEVARLLKRKPNAWQTPSEFKRQLMMAVLLYGNGYALKIQSRRRILAIVPLHPAAVTVEQTDDWTLRYKYRRKDGAEITYSQDEILHLRGPGGDGITGASVIQFAADTIGLNQATSRHAGNLFRNGAAVSGVLTHPKQLGDPQIQRLKAGMEEFRSGGVGAMKTLVLEEDMKYERLAMTSVDAQLLQTLEASAVAICGFFGVPPYMVGYTTKSTSWGTGIEQQQIGFIMTTLGPWMTMWAEAINRDLIGPDDLRFYAKFNPASLIRGDIKSRYAAYAVGRQWGFLCVDEIREMEDRNALPDGQGKVYLEPANMVPAGSQTESSAGDPQPSDPVDPSDGNV